LALLRDRYGFDGPAGSANSFDEARKSSFWIQLARSKRGWNLPIGWDVFHVGAAIKAETYEICEYESLIDMAREMKHTKVAQLLSQNLQEEQAALKKMEGFRKTIKPNEMMNEEQQKKAQAASSSSRGKRVA
jgi:hypothetical protein